MGDIVISLIKNYINKLDINTLKEFGIKNDIILSDTELEYIFKLVKDNIDNILIDEKPYLNMIKNNISQDNYIKIENLVNLYKDKYKGYLF